MVHLINHNNNYKILYFLNLLEVKEEQFPKTEEKRRMKLILLIEDEKWTETFNKLMTSVMQWEGDFRLGGGSIACNVRIVHK